MDNLNLYLYWAAGALTLVQILFWAVPTLRRNPQWAGAVETIDSLWVAMVVALAIKSVIVQPFTVPSGSMEDTLRVGDYLLVKKYEYGYSLWNSTNRFLEFQKPQRGDVVVFVYPKDHSKDFVKRCIGTPGDVIAYRDKDLYVNGVQQVEPYVQHIDPYDYKITNPPQQLSDPDSTTVTGVIGTRDNFGPVTVQAGHYFMMGDNRDNSLDSRFWGQVDEKLLKGKAWILYWHSVNFVPDLSRMFKLIR
jgi:signal peptidase I